VGGPRARALASRRCENRRNEQGLFGAARCAARSLRLIAARCAKRKRPACARLDSHQIPTVGAAPDYGSK
jgi:hypothetical protein